jgi:type IV secretory pathway TraG/TraD family ATPase VirD4
MRRTVFALAAVGLIYLGSSAYSLYGQLFPATEKTKTVSTQTRTDEVSGAPPPEDTNPEQGSDDTSFLESIFWPGLLILTALSFIPDSVPEWVFAFIVSWWVWGTALKWMVIPATRICGIGYAPSRFRFFVWLLPPWRPFYGLIRPFVRWFRFLTFGLKDTDRWASLPELLYHYFRPGKLLLGRFALWGIGFLQPVAIRTNRHAMMLAGPGSGKSVMLCTIALCHRGAIVVTDCDGQIITATARRKAAQGMTIANLDPYGLAPHFNCSGWNVFNEIDDALKLYGESAAFEWAITIAHALIKTVPGVNSWVFDEGRVVIVGLILYVWKYAKPENRNLVFLKKLIALGQFEKARPQDDAFEVLVLDLKRRTDFDGAMAASGVLLERSMGGKGGGKSPVLATLVEELSWLDIPAMAQNVKRDDLRCHDVQKGKTCVYIVATTVDLQGQLSPWNRLLTNTLLYTFQRAKGRPRDFVLFCCDEYPNAHRNNPMIMRMAGVSRKYKIQFLIICQTITQIRAVHPEDWSDFIGTSDACIFMGTGDQPTLELLSTLLGKRTQDAKVSGGILSSLRAHPKREDRALMSPGQLREFLGAANNIIVTRANARPMKLKSEAYFKAVPVGWYDADRHHPETLPRAFTRRILRLLAGLKRRATPPSKPNRREQSPVQ